jgi:hypothetical protein
VPEEEEDDDEETEDESESSNFLANAASFALAMRSLGAFFRNSRSSSVNGPSPIEVKKLIA